MHHRTEQEIMQNWKGDLTTPVVSICYATYNHENFILDALHGFLRQVTTFPFEIIIRDDASTDGTTQIVREYAKKYPHIIRAVIETENQFSKGVRPNHAWSTVTRGEYIALCEGDDYWISSCKLQQQVELLEKHPEAVMFVAKTDICEQCEDSLRYIRTIDGNDNKIFL